MIQVTGFRRENLPSSTPTTPLTDSDDPAPVDRPLPLAVQRLEGVKFRVGPSGAVIGFGRDCGIRLPKEAGTLEHHVQLEWCPTESSHHTIVSDTEPHGVSIVVTRDDTEPTEKSCSCLWDDGHFKLIDLNGDTTVLTPSGDPSAPLELELTASSTVKPHTYRLECLGRFVTGCLEWTLKPLPIRHYISAKMFAAVKSGNMILLENIVAEAEHYGISISGSTKAFSRTPSLGPAVAIDFNVEEDLSSDEEIIEHPAVYAGLCRIPARQTVLSERDKRSLLHLAIECQHKEVVKFLLAKGARVGPYVVLLITCIAWVFSAANISTLFLRVHP